MLKIVQYGDDFHVEIDGSYTLWITDDKGYASRLVCWVESLGAKRAPFIALMKTPLFSLTAQ